jgi:hypothetical protein
MLTAKFANSLVHLLTCAHEVDASLFLKYFHGAQHYKYLLQFMINLNSNVIIYIYLGRIMAQAVIRRLVITEARVRSQIIQCGICVG